MSGEEEQQAFGSPVDDVQLDGLVLLKIIKHCHENFPSWVNGQLLGLDSQRKLEITSCFPHCDDDSDDQYSVEMLKALREINIDNNVVGWYQSAFIGSWLSASNLKVQYDYQAKIPGSVMVVYDPFRTARGTLSLKAYRLSDAFMSFYSKKKRGPSVEAFKRNGVDSQNIYEELPIKVHNSHLVHAFLYEIREGKSMSCTPDRLQISSSKELSSQLKYLAGCIDDYSEEQRKYQREMRGANKSLGIQKAKLEEQNKKRARMGQDPLPADAFRVDMPSRLEAFLFAKSVDVHAEQLLDSTNLSMFRSLTVEAMQGEDDGEDAP